MLWQVDVSALEKEDAELAERHRKLAKKYDTKFQFAARKAAIKAKLPAGAVTNFSKEMGYILSTIATHSDEAAVDEMVDKLAFEFVNDPESFSDAVRNQGKKNATNGLFTEIRNLIRGFHSVPNRTGAAVHQSLVHNISRLPEDVKDGFADFFDRLRKTRCIDGLLQESAEKYKKQEDWIEKDRNCTYC